MGLIFISCSHWEEPCLWFYAYIINTISGSRYNLLINMDLLGSWPMNSHPHLRNVVKYVILMRWMKCWKRFWFICKYVPHTFEIRGIGHSLLINSETWMKIIQNGKIQSQWLLLIFGIFCLSSFFQVILPMYSHVNSYVRIQKKSGNFQFFFVEWRCIN